MRVGGCQIPVTRDVQLNISEIKKAIDWANANSVELLVTPECALSGYLWMPNGFMDQRIVEVAKAMKEVVSYAKDMKVDLVLGTSAFDNTLEGQKYYNQARVYVDGELVHKHNKIITTHDELYAKGEELKTFLYKGVKTAVLICNDYWACGFQDPGQAGRLPKQLADENVKLCLLPANAPRIIEDPDYYYRWNEIHVESYSRQGGFAVVVADNCYQQWGEEYNSTTGCPSGVFNGIVGWGAKTPKQGTHYFTYDLELEKAL
jgi:predicted amidohydrolase